MAALASLGTNPRPEVLTKDGMFRVDISLVWDGRRFAVEADGPHHFTLSRPHRPLGRAVARRRCLQARGWAVVSVPFYEWRDVTRRSGGGTSSAAAGGGGGGSEDEEEEGCSGGVAPGVLARQAAYLRAALERAAGTAPHSLADALAAGGYGDGDGGDDELAGLGLDADEEGLGGSWPSAEAGAWDRGLPRRGATRPP